MDPFVFGAVLFAAACHASWNALIKIRLDPFATTAIITVACGVIALPTLPFVGLPPLSAWPWVAASVILHLAYYIGLTEAYRTGDMSQVYPIARGSAPLMTALVSTHIYRRAFKRRRLDRHSGAGRAACSCCRRAAVAIWRASTAARSALRCSPRSRSVAIR